MNIHDQPLHTQRLNSDAPERVRWYRTHLNSQANQDIVLTMLYGNNHTILFCWNLREANSGSLEGKEELHCSEAALFVSLVAVLSGLHIC